MLYHRTCTCCALSQGMRIWETEIFHPSRTDLLSRGQLSQQTTVADRPLGYASLHQTESSETAPPASDRQRWVRKARVFLSKAEQHFWAIFVLELLPGLAEIGGPASQFDSPLFPILLLHRPLPFSRCFFLIPKKCLSPQTPECLLTANTECVQSVISCTL